MYYLKMCFMFIYVKMYVNVENISISLIFWNMRTFYVHHIGLTFELRNYCVYWNTKYIKPNKRMRVRFWSYFVKTIYNCLSMWITRTINQSKVVSLWFQFRHVYLYIICVNNLFWRVCRFIKCNEKLNSKSCWFLGKYKIITKLVVIHKSQDYDRLTFHANIFLFFFIMSYSSFRALQQIS